MQMDLETESLLCRSCGLCCQGQLYSFVILHPEEMPLAKNWPVEIMTQGKEVGFKQPCACFQDMHCSVYLQRPKTCKDYYCNLVLRLRRNEISAAEALAKISQTREKFEIVQALLPAAGNQRSREPTHLGSHPRALESGAGPVLAGKRRIVNG